MNSFFAVSMVFSIATVLAFIMRRLRIPLIVGYLVTGVLVGPLALNIVQAGEQLRVFSQLGISALLFIIGLTLSPRILKEMGRAATLLGLLQGGITAIPAFFLAKVFGFESIASAYIAVALTLSSTIVVSKVLSDKKALGTLHGKITIGFLLAQDVLAAGVLLVMGYVGRGGTGGGLLASFGITAGFFILLYAMSAKILPKLTTFFASSQDILFLFSLGWGIGIAGVFAFLGLSFELGALAAGIALASSPYHHELGMRMRVVRDFFLVIFFALLGSELAVPFGQIPWKLVAALSTFVLIGKPIFVMGIMRGLGFHQKASFLSGVSIAQVSEFSFILIALGVGVGQVPEQTLPMFILVGIVTIAGSSLYMNAGERLYAAYEKWMPGLFWRGSAQVAKQKNKMTPKVILIGCHRTGAHVLPMLERWREPYLVVDFDPGIIKGLEDRNIPCVYGDASEQELLDEAGIKQADIIISTIPEPGVQRAILRNARRGKKPALVFLVASSTEQALELYKEGATSVVNLYDIGGAYTALLVEQSRKDVGRIGAERRKHISELRKAAQGRISTGTDIHHRWAHLHE